MRQLLPDPGDLDLSRAFSEVRTPPGGRPWTLGLLVSSADGAAALDGRSGPLGGELDTLVFRAVRALADAIVVGAGTVRTERYGPARTAAAHVDERRQRGQAAHPRLVIVSGRLDLPLDLPLFETDDGAGPPPAVIHPPGVDARRVRALAGRADLWEVPAGSGRGVDVEAALQRVATDGAAVAVVEGGPTLNGDLVAADAIDEVSLTLDPRIVGGGEPRIVAGDGPGHLRPWRTAALLEGDGVLVWRLVRDRLGEGVPTL